MSAVARNLALFAVMALLFTIVGFIQSWDVSLTLLNMCIISAIMALGVNIQWGYAGLFNVGTMGFAALGGLAAMLVSVPPVTAAWQAGGMGIFGAILAALLTVAAGDSTLRLLPPLVIGDAEMDEFIEKLSAGAADFEVPEAS